MPPVAVAQLDVEAGQGLQAPAAAPAPAPDNPPPEHPGPETVTLAEDACASAFILALNATTEMYSFWPCRNKSMRPTWLALSLLGFCQILILVVLLMYPPPSRSSTFLVDCAAPKSVPAQLLNGDIISIAHAKSDPVELTPSGLANCLALEVDVIGGNGIEYRTLVHSTTCFQELFTASAPSLWMVQFVCLMLLFTEMYVSDFWQVRSLLVFYDFNRWWLKVKGEKLRDKRWALIIPMLQYAICVAVNTASMIATFGYTTAIDVLFNAVAFTFIGRIAEFFNHFVLAFYEKAEVQGLDVEEYGPDPIKYLVTDFDASQCTPDSWYVHEDEDGAGLITDFQFRHAPTKYPKKARRLILALKMGFFIIPTVGTLLVWRHQHS